MAGFTLRGGPVVTESGTAGWTARGGAVVQETAGGGGTTHSVSITESVGVTSSVAAQALFSGALTESVGAADSISAVATKLAQAAEPIGIADAANGGVIASVGAASESIGVSDSSDASVVTGGTVHSVSITEAVGIASSASALVIANATITEAIGIAAAQGATAVIVAQITEAVSIADSMAGNVLASVSAPSETVGVAASSDASVVTGGTIHSVSITEAVGVASSVTAQAILSGALTESVGATDSISVVATKLAQIAEAVGITATQNALVPGGALGAPLVQGIRSLTKDTAVNIMVLMVDSADHITALSGLSLACELSKDGGAFSAISPSVTEAGNGWYRVQLAATDTDTYGDLVLHVTATGADPSDVVSQVRDIAQEVLTAATAAPIHADFRKAIGQAYHGDGSTGDKLRSTLVP